MVKKAVKLEVLVLMEPGVSDAEIIKWVKSAMEIHCDFEHPVVTIKAKHEKLIWAPETDVQA